MTSIDIFYKILNSIGWIWFYIKKPFKWYMKQKFKVKLIILILILALFDNLRYYLFNILVWLLK